MAIEIRTYTTLPEEAKFIRLTVFWEAFMEKWGVEGGPTDTGTFEFRPCGSGVQDFAAILEASEKAGADWCIVEQDSPSMGKSSLECAEMSIKYLKGLVR